MQENTRSENLPVLWLDGKRFIIDIQKLRVWNFDDPSECYDLEFLDLHTFKPEKHRKGEIAGLEVCYGHPLIQDGFHNQKNSGDQGDAL